MELTPEAVAKDAFRRDFFLRCFPAREAQALELRFAFLHRVRQYKRLVGRRDLLPRAAKEIVASYLQQVESTNQLLLPESAEPLRGRVLAAVAAGHCPLDLFNGVETLVREHMTRDAFPQFLRSKEYTELCDALRSRRELPLAEVLVDSRRTQFLSRFLTEAFPGEEGNLRFWVHVQTRFLPLIQTTLFSVALFEEVQRHVRHVFNRFLVGETEGGEGASAATRVPETVRRATLQQIMRLQSEPFSPPRYANLFRAAQDCVWNWLQTEVYPKFRASSLYVMLVVETEDLETDQQLRRLSEHVQATVKKSATVRQERQSETIPKLTTRKSEAQLKANAVLVPIKQPPIPNLWGQEADCCRSSFDRVITVQALAYHGIQSISVASMSSQDDAVEKAGQVVYELFCTGDEQEASAETHPMHLNYWMKNEVEVSGNPLSPSGRSLQSTVPKPSFHDFVVPKEKDVPGGMGNTRYLFGVCLTIWRQNQALQNKANSPKTSELVTSPHETIGKKSVITTRQIVTVLTTSPAHKKSRKLLLQLVSGGMDNLAEDVITGLLPPIYADELSCKTRRLLSKYGGFCLQPNLCVADLSLSAVFKEISSQTLISILATVLVGKSIILVSERTAALVSVAEAVRELLKPFEWTHFYLPFCPVATSSELRDAGLFSEVNTSPFLLGCEGVLTSQKKDSGSDQRFRIRNSLYTTHKVSLHLEVPVAAPSEYPPDLLQASAIIVDIDSDDIYVPEKVEIPELPQSLLRSLESMLSMALLSSRITQADSHIFGPSKTPSCLSEMLEETLQIDEPSAEMAPQEYEQANLSLDDRARLAILWFLEALFGDVVYYFCSFHQNFAVESQSASADVDEFLLFEVDSFLDAHTELGCRDFFRQSFHTELFRKFMLAQHMQFSFSIASDALTSSEATPLQSDQETPRDSPPDAFI